MDTRKGENTTTRMYSIIPKLISSPHSSNTGDDQVLPNPTHGHTPTTPSVQYSVLGPRGALPTHAYDVIDMNSAPSQPQGGDERVYHVLEGLQEEEERGGGELARTVSVYEVPISTTPAPAQPAAQQVD
jgi:hypothetical protein